MINRRLALAAIAGAFVFLSAASVTAQTPSRTVDAAKVFPKLKDYLELPAAERSHFSVAFALKLEGGAETDAFLLRTGSVERPLVFNAAGFVANPPTIEELRSGAVVIVKSAAKASSTMALEPVLPLGLTIDAADAARAVAQANRAIGRFGGALGMMAPKMKGVRFIAPAAAAGVAVMADGKRTPLVFQEDGFAFTPGSAKGAVRIEFAVIPTAAAFIP